MKKSILFAIVLFSQTAFSGVSTSWEVEGKIIKMDTSTVTLWSNGKEVKVPRTAIPKYFTVRPGNKVVAFIAKEQAKRKK